MKSRLKVCFWLAGIGFLFGSWPLASESGSLTVSVLPTLSIPVGPTVDGDLLLYGLGGGGSIRGDYLPPFASFLFGRAVVDFDYMPFNGAAGGLTILSGGLSAGLNLSPTPRFAWRLGGGGGIYLGSTEIGTVRNPYLEAGTELSLRLGPTFEVGLGARYRHLSTPNGPLYQGLSIQLGAGYDLTGTKKGTRLQIQPQIFPIFPLFYSYYDKNPAGEVVIVNQEGSRFDNVKISFYAMQYMDSPRVSADLGSLRAGESRSIPVYALFNDSIFRITEGTKTAGEIIVEYTYMGKARRISVPLTIEIYNRNALTWDDDRKAAAFVTAKDPMILGFSKNVASSIRAEGYPPVSENFRTAMGLFQSLTLYGLGYTVDPKTPYNAFSGREEAVDFLQFPNQTLSYRGGDCDDISVLYAALLEAVGIESALLTTPGHIFVAFNSGLSPDQSTRFFGVDGDFIEADGKVWIPVEITLVREGFARAWRTGAQQWRQSESQNSAAMYPVQEAWQTYEPVGFVEGGIPVTLPASDRIADSYRREMARVLENLVNQRIAEIRSADTTARKPAEYTSNRVGIVYAQFGMLDKAVEQFNQAIQRSRFAPAYTNLGNIFYIRKEMPAAYEQYSKALELAPQSTAALSGAVRSLYAMENYQSMEQALAELTKINPAIAASVNPRTAQQTTARAAESSAPEVSEWDE